MSFPVIQLKRATAAEWATINPILQAGEVGYERDVTNSVPASTDTFSYSDPAFGSGAIKIGDGITPWRDLPYLATSLRVTGGSAYSLPVASAAVLGGVRIGSGVSIDGSGVISVSGGGSYTLPQATSVSLGGVIVGAGLSVSSGTISVSYGSIANTACQGNDSRLSDARTPTAHNQAWSTITATPTTLAGYGITDAVSSSDSRLSDARTPTAHNQAWSTITSTPTTLGGYGIADAVGSSDARLADSRTPLAHNQAWSTITATPTTLSGYGITDAVSSSDSRLTDARAPLSHTHAASAIVSGIMDAARLGGGVASNATFLRGDGQWATPAGGGGASSRTVQRFTARDNQPPASGFATLDQRNSVLVLEYDPATEESAVFVGVVSEGASLAGGLVVRLWWMADTATSGNVRWGVALEKAGTDLDANSFDTSSEVTSAASATSGVESIAEISIATIDALAAGDRFRLRVYRAAADAVNDTMLGDAQLVAVEVRSA